MFWDDYYDDNNNGGVTQSTTRKSTRPSRGKYVPRHLRNTKPSSPPRYGSSESTRFTRSPLGPPGNSLSDRGRGRVGSGRGRNRFVCSPKRYTSNNLLDVTEKFEELELTEDESNSANAVINFDVYDDIPVEVSGSNVPASVMSFAEVDLGEVLYENIKRCKYVKPTPIQKHAIPIAVAGRDLMACAQTGSGKTAAFCFPIISGILKQREYKVAGFGRGGGTHMAKPSALILSPTRELSCQIHEEARKFAYNTGLKIVVAYGGAPIVQQFRNLKKGVDILVATPGRLVDMIEREKVSLSVIKYLAIDEADRMLDMGFEPQVRKIVLQMGMPPPGERQTMLFSATFPNEIQRLASDFLTDYIFLTVGRVGSSTDLIAQRVELVRDEDKRNHLKDLLRMQTENGTHDKRTLTLVFVETKRGADSLEYWLSKKGFPAIAIHGDKVQVERERALRSFKSGAIPILVATDVASRGLDIPCVSHVINFDLPKDIDSYVHRIGRTGRAGKSGQATAFFSDKNAPLAKALAELMQETKQEVPAWLSQYAENSESSSYDARSNHYGGGNFGAYDFRNDSHFVDENHHYSGAFSGKDSYASSGAFGCSDPVSADYYAAASTDYVSASHGYGFGHDSVVATGWD